MATVCIHGKMEESIKDSTITIRSTGMGSIAGLMAESSKGSGSAVREKGKGR